MLKSISHLGSLFLIACSLTVMATSRPAVAQASEYSDYDQPEESLSNSDYDQLDEEVSIDSFEDKLAPHGRWIDTSEYGRVWIPNVDRDFQPYATNGHWVVTEYGNTWVSDYEWGWAAFHYGRWYRHSQYGWAWVPGTEWGPAWVSWRSGGGYYGWAPLTPSVSININIPLNFWTFVPQQYITSSRVYDYYIPRPRISNFYYNTTVINNTYRVRNRNYIYGPRRQEIENVTRRRVDVYSIDRLNQPSRSVVTGRTIRIYRPEVSEQRRSPQNRARIYNPNTTEPRVYENRRSPENRGRIFNPNQTEPRIYENRRYPQSGGRVYNPNTTEPRIYENRRYPQGGGRVYNPNTTEPRIYENRRTPDGGERVNQQQPPSERRSGGRVWRAPTN